MNNTPTTRHSILSVWHWRLPQGTWFIIVPLMLMAYFLSAGLVLFLKDVGVLSGDAPMLLVPVEIAFYPAFLIAMNCEFLESILTWETDTLFWFYACSLDF